MWKVFSFIGNLFLDFIETLVMALSIFVVVYLFFFQPHQVKGSSMVSSFTDGEYILTNKISYQFGKPQRGDVIIFASPVSEDDYIKRIIGLPGDSVRLSGSKIYINDNLLDESHYLDSDKTTNPGYFLREGQAVEVPEESYFAMGDNRNNSSDSRDWGFVPYKNIKGKAWFRYWPPKNLGLIKNVSHY